MFAINILALLRSQLQDNVIIFNLLQIYNIRYFIIP